jgi:hypothetical protein
MSLKTANNELHDIEHLRKPELVLVIGPPCSVREIFFSSFTSRWWGEMIAQSVSIPYWLQTWNPLSFLNNLPFSKIQGKTRYCHTQLSTHHYISLTSFFRQHQDSSLHRLLNAVVQVLTAGQDVVLDDNSLANARTRKSIVDMCRSRLSTSVVIRYVIINPVGGILQCQWANEFALAGV